MKLQTELAPLHKSGLLLRNPVMTAAGTFGYGIEYAKIADVQHLGAVICKGTTLHSRSGNPRHRAAKSRSACGHQQIRHYLGNMADASACQHRG